MEYKDTKNKRGSRRLGRAVEGRSEYVSGVIASCYFMLGEIVREGLKESGIHMPHRYDVHIYS